ncbi:putative tail fiber protein [Flavobacterium phage vB_FspP_elemoA_1-9C]|jgi:hypothetical protein|uniref:Tail fiber protein n=4 Tax=Elemovirus TaxID=2948694 RepID=A0A7D7IN09_9CAUD|nr:tail fiber protein [Flavobacterium phage vB_FspP_elemoA_7-9A]YP_010108963.1 tail fiber protein [Flavobacterium phage vB_FspP_elemoF_6-3D]YP_010109051.1 tail fiber protein [Flavobacterium phage vB_FspP_elemoE_6-9C]YP_010109101.1 tail fiber protein [Flavobacterium phage vB_FspP_elemoD_13-5B]QMP84677.1 putative tail fiber protein [Flavobacterium phage vB_FspP_elemoA_13-1A]QMP84768.1 putative tail fiber protein [Flavobacterium phage vB_FspP_elemoC_13-1C]QMP85040.1 putative tail fiber protein [
MATIPSGTKFLGVDPAFTDLTERKGTKVDRKTEYFTLEDITATVGVGSEGPQGVEGPAGPPGPVGPAGLEWQGAWDTDSSYAEDDAVGFNGASWFCISAVTGTGNSNPEEDTTHWALLAAQGAQGIQGIQGPTGPQGPSGSVTYTEESRNTSALIIAQNPASLSSKITKNFTRAYVTSDVNNYLGLSDLGKVVGDSFVVRNQSSSLPIIVTLLDNARLLGTNGFETTTSFEIKPNTYARFTLVTTTGGSDKVFMAEVIRPLGLASLPYRTYVAQITPVDISTITVNVLENTLGTTVTATWVSGKINITLGEELITLTNPYMSVSNYFANGIYHIVTPSLLGFDLIELASYKASGTPSVGWSFGERINFELRLYS